MSPTMDDSDRAINWGAYREGVLSTLPRFESLPRGGVALIRSYQDVLDRDETFTQYFSDQRLKSYDTEANIRKTLGIGPPCLSDPEASGSANEAIISWTNIFRHGDFEKQPNGAYLCRMQGRLVEIDESVHKSIMLTRCIFPEGSQAWPDHVDVKREYEISLEVEDDVRNEIKSQAKYVEKLERLRKLLRKRRSKLQAIIGSGGQTPVKKERTPEGPHSQHTTPAVSRPTVSVDSPDARARNVSENSGVSTGDDIPYGASRDSSAPLALGNPDESDDPLSGRTVERETNDQPLSTPSQVIGREPPSRTSVPQNMPEKDRNHAVDNASSPYGFIPINHTRDRMADRAMSTPKRSLQDSHMEDASQFSPKRQKTVNPASTDGEALDYSQELPMRDVEILDSPQRPTQGEGKKPKKDKKKRERNNFTDFEKEHAPAWLRTLFDELKPASEIEQEYLRKFGVWHSIGTLKSWLGRMEQAPKARNKNPNPANRQDHKHRHDSEIRQDSENPQDPESKIVVLKSPDSQAQLNTNSDPVPTSQSQDPAPALAGFPTPSSYTSPYAQPRSRASEEPQASSIGYTQEMRAKSVMLGDTPMKNGLPNF